MKYHVVLNNYLYGENRIKKMREQFSYKDELIDAHHHIVFFDLNDEQLKYINYILPKNIKLKPTFTDEEKFITLAKNAVIKDSIRKTNEGYIVFSEKGKKLSKAYQNKEDAEKRLAQIEKFKHMADSDDLPMWIYERIVKLPTWIEMEDETEIKNADKLVKFSWSFIKNYLTPAINKLFENIRNVSYFNRTAKAFYSKGLGDPHYKSSVNEREIVDHFVELKKKIIDEINIITKHKPWSYKPTFRKYMLDIYDLTNGQTYMNDSIHDAQKTLNSIIWNEDNSLKQEVKDKIEIVVDKFVDWLKEDGIEINISDIILIGSNASYNYTKKSDLDVHILVDEDDETLLKLYNVYKTLFNDTYDIKFKNIRVEIYVQKSTQGLYSNAIYSINNGWIREPIKEEINDINVTNEVKEFKQKIDALIEKDAQINDIDSLLNNIYSLRQSALENEGEYSKGNAIFKELRRIKYIDKLKEFKTKKESKEMSLRDSEVKNMKFENLEKTIKKLNSPEIIDGEEFEPVFNFKYKVEGDVLYIYDINEAYNINYLSSMNEMAREMSYEFGFKYVPQTVDEVHEKLEKAIKADLGQDAYLEWEDYARMVVALPENLLIEDANFEWKIERVYDSEELTNDKNAWKTYKFKVWYNRDFENPEEVLDTDLYDLDADTIEINARSEKEACDKLNYNGEVFRYKILK